MTMEKKKHTINENSENNPIFLGFHNRLKTTILIEMYKQCTDRSRDDYHLRIASMSSLVRL